jgi:uncharacterized membrane protein
MYRFTLMLVAAAAGALLLYGLGRVVLVLVMAMFFAYLIAPLVAAAECPCAPREPRGACLAAWSSASSMWPSPE